MHLDSIVSYLRSVAPAGAGDDAQLLTRFAAGDQAAFAALMRRYAGLVWGVCRRTLGQAADAEDAFQATFLVLTLKARSLGGGPLGPWLHTVASRTAAKAGAGAQVRAARETTDVTAEPAVHDPPPDDDTAGLLDEEIGRLPEKYRGAVILCYLEGMTNAQAAERLGCPKGTVLSRLSRARELLRRRLERRGVELAASPGLPTSPPPELMETAARVGAGAAAAPASVLSLAQGVTSNVTLHKTKLLALTLLAASLAGGAGLWASLSAAGTARPDDEQAREAKQGRNDKKVKEEPQENSKRKLDEPKPEPEAKPDDEKPKPAEEKKERVRLTAREIHLALGETITFEGIDDPKTTLAEQLDRLSERSGISFDVNEKAFEFEMLNDVMKTEIAPQGNPIPKLKNATLGAVLKKTLQRVPVPSGITYVVRKDHVEITTDDAVRRELGLSPRKRDEEGRPIEPMVRLVWQEFHRESLAAALRKIADDLDVNVVLDARCEEKAAVRVTASLHNVSVETAVRLLAHQAGLSVVKVENVYYVTSAADAATLKK